MGQPQDDERTRDALLAEIEALRTRVGKLEGRDDSAKTARENILVEEAKYRTILENLRDVIFTYNTSGIITFITTNVSRYGYTVDDIVGKSVLEFIDPSEHAWVVEVIKNRIATGDEAPIEVRLVTKQSGIRIMEDYVKAVWDDNGRIINIVGILHDVTENRENQRALEKNHAELESRVEARTMELSEAYLNLKEEVRRREVAQQAQEESERLLSEEHRRLASILDGSPVSSFVIDRGHRVTAWNMVNEFFTGIPKDVVLGKPLDLSPLFKDRMQPSLADLVLELTDEEIIKRYGHKGIRKSEIHPQAFETVGSIWIKGVERIMAIQSTRLRDVAGNVVGAIQCAQDITGQKRAEEALKNELNKFRVLYELSLNMSAERRLEDNLSFIIKISRYLLKADTAYVALADDEKQFVYMHTLSGIRTEAFKKMKLPFGKGLGGLVMTTRQGYIVENYLEHAGINHVVDEIVAREGVISGMAVPIQAGERSLGVLYVFNRQITEFSKSDLETLYFLGNLAGVEIARKRMERDLRESEVKYRTVFENSGSAMVIIEEDTNISLANDKFVRLSGFDREDVEGKKKWTEFVVPEDLSLMMEQHKKRRKAKDRAPRSYEFRFVDRWGQVKDILVNVDMMPNSSQSVASLVDISDRKRAEAAIKQAYDDLETRVAARTIELTAANSRLNELLQKQNVNVDIAKSIMGIIDGSPPRHKEIGVQTDLFVSTLYLPCYTEGGDHFLIKHIDDPARKAKTIISLKDQSGHEVSCILRSIITDIFHNAVIAQSSGELSLAEEISRLNDIVSSLDVFGAENFFTAINVDIEHSNLLMHYLAAGHPPLLLIRHGDVIALPGLHEKGRNLPIGVIGGVQYEAGVMQLQMGDKLILFTDGLIEIPCRKGLPILKYEELCDIVKDLLRTQPDLKVSEIIPALLIAVAGQEDWDQENRVAFNDDVTVLGIEIEDRASGEELLFNPRDREDFAAQFTVVYDRIKSQWVKQGLAGGEMRLRMVLEEALANAWIHGHGQQPHRPIVVRHRYGNDAVIEIIDQGEGFDGKSLSDPTTFKNRFKESGRGVYIIRLYADEVYWKDGGRHLVAYFSLAENLPQRAKQGTTVDIWSRKDWS